VTSLKWGHLDYGADDPRYRFAVHLWVKHPKLDSSRWLESSAVASNFDPPDHSQPLHEFLSRVAAELSSSKSAFARLHDEGGSAGLSIGMYLQSHNAGIELPAELCRRLADLGLDLDFDLYCEHNELPDAAVSAA
jgi:hypothetical protein